MPALLRAEFRASLLPWHRPEAHPVGARTVAEIIRVPSTQWRDADWRPFAHLPIDSNPLTWLAAPFRTFGEVYKSPLSWATSTRFSHRQTRRHAESAIYREQRLPVALARVNILSKSPLVPIRPAQVPTAIHGF